MNEKKNDCDEDSKGIMHLVYGYHNVNGVWKSFGKMFNLSVRLFSFIQSLRIYFIKSINSKCHAEYKSLFKPGENLENL